MRVAISIESRIAMTLQKVGIRNMLCTIGEVCEVAKNTISKSSFVMHFCAIFKSSLV